MRRKHRHQARAWSILCVLLLLFPASANAQAAAARNVAGIWWITTYSPKMQIEGGGELPFTQQGRTLYDRNMAGLANGSITDEARRICVPDGVPRVLMGPYPFKIVHTPGQTTIIYELNHVVRLIPMDKPQLSQDELEILPYYSGHSVGHWEGDTLVIETAGFNEKTFIDAKGTPHSDQLRTVERVHKINGGKQLEIVVTVTDPIVFTRPWSARFVYDAHPKVRLQDYICGEPHRDISLVPGVTEARRANGTVQ
jgi:hypothetical protein